MSFCGGVTWIFRFFVFYFYFFKERVLMRGHAMPIQRDFLAIGLLYKEAAGAAVSSLIVELKKICFSKKKVLCSSLTDKKKKQQ